MVDGCERCKEKMPTKRVKVCKILNRGLISKESGGVLPIKTIGRPRE